MTTTLLRPQYTTIDSVKVRLAGKVQFQQSPDQIEPGELPDALFHQLIVDAETEVEQDLRSRYAIPFQSKTFKTYPALPDHSRRAIRVAVDMKSVMMVLQTDFGRGTHIQGDDYFDSLKESYQEYLKKLLGQDSEGEKRERFRFSPPLEDLLLAVSNSEADDGYKGMIINTDQDRRDAVTYAEEQMNNPSESYVGRQKNGVTR
jgi:hypothetical protein